MPITIHSSNCRWRVVVAAFLTYLLVVVTWLPLTGSAQIFLIIPRRAQQQPAQYREGELLVRFRAGVSSRDQDAIIARHGVQKKKDLRGESGIGKLKVIGRDVGTVALEMLLNPQVEFVEPNFLIAKDDVIPNDARFDEQWTLRNTGQNSGQVGSDINASGAWEITTGSRSTVIAVIDSGVDFSHPDLANNQWLNPTPGEDGDLHGWDYIANSPAIQDEQGHGTAVAGIIAAEGNNSLGMTGVMWRASLMSLRVLDNAGNGDVANAVEAIDYAVAHGAHVINLSWGTAGESLALKQAIERALRRDVAVVCSAGNSGQDLDTSPYYPASFGLKDLITVAATDNHDQATPWSNWGTRKVTVAAPGTNILTTQRGSGYWSVTGTSAAAPLVSGIAGLLKTSRPAVNASLIAKAISDGTRKVASLFGKVTSGGVASAAGALAKLHGPAISHPDLFHRASAAVAPDRAAVSRLRLRPPIAAHRGQTYQTWTRSEPRSRNRQKRVLRFNPTCPARTVTHRVAAAARATFRPVIRTSPPRVANQLMKPDSQVSILVRVISTGVFRLLLFPGGRVWTSVSVFLTTRSFGPGAVRL